MVIFLKTDGNGKGDAQIITPEVVYQGSDNVTDITVIAPFSAQTAMSIGFILPDGLYWFARPLDPNDPHSGGNYAPMVFVKQDFTTKANVWKYTLPRSVTEMHGVVQIALNAAYMDGETQKANCTSFLCDFTVQESVVPSLPATEPPADVYELLRQYLAYLDARTANVPNLVKSIQQTASNAFTFTKNNGDVSKPIVFGKAGYDPIYDVAAYVGEIAGPTEENPNGEWQPNNPTNPTSYSHVIDADTHGQMQEGVSADDLWVSFVSANGTGFDGVYQGYTVDAAGNITITATTPVALTVRVWNGKGLTDEISREQIIEETERAQNAEQMLNADIVAEKSRAVMEERDLQAQIDEIIQSGHDAIAREQIASEIERAATAEMELDEKIVSNTSDINSLRKDFANESHFRGYLMTNDEVRSLIATPNDFAYSAQSGTVWVYTGVAWIDSGEKVPDQISPASNVLPLMDGVAEVGNATSYARADHRHPMDSTRASTAIATQISSGLMSAEDKKKLDELMVGSVTGVKGNEESDYRTGNVNITPSNIGALSIKGGTIGNEQANIAVSPGFIQVTGKSNQTVTYGMQVGNGFGDGIIIRHDKIILTPLEDYKIVIGSNTGEVPSLVFNENGSVNMPNGVKDGDQRVYSPNNPPPIDKLLAYPIGALYISTSSTSPASLFGGSWTSITSGYYLRTVTSGSGNYYPAGLPNISGSFECIAYMDNRTGTGALKNTDPTNGSTFISSGTGTKNNRYAPYSFDASRSNSLYGNSTTVTPQNYTVYMWRRTA